jgi:transposase
VTTSHAIAKRVSRSTTRDPCRPRGWHESGREIARAGKAPKVVLEATFGWYWAADTLAAAGAEVRLAHPLGVKAFTYRRVKNDERDAAHLADLLRMGPLPEAWIAPAQVRELRELTRYRHKLVHLRTSCKDQVHGVLAKLGIPVTCTDIFGVAGSAWLDGLGLPQPYAGKVTSLRHLTGELRRCCPCCRVCPSGAATTTSATAPWTCSPR